MTTSPSWLAIAIITGGYEAMPRGKKFPNTHPITVEYLKPIMPSTTDTYDEISEKVKNAIMDA